jgi:hypothetical protein
MSLLIDDDHITLSDLLAIDPEVSEIADAEGITVEGDVSIARQAWDECADVLLENMQSFGGDLIGWPGTLSTYGGFGVTRPRVRLNQIIVSAQYGRRISQLRRWMIYRALVLFYRAASNRRVSDRYTDKHDRMVEDAKRSWRSLWASGLPIVALPLACPGATHEVLAGDWGNGNLAFVDGGTEAETSYSVAITWVDATQYVSPANKGNAESGPSRILTATIPANKRLQVNISGLVPPGSVAIRRGLADGPYIARTASHWNVYVGTLGGVLYLQNASPVPVGTSSYTLAGAPVLSGYTVDAGQVPDANFTFQRTIQRG